MLRIGAEMLSRELNSLYEKASLTAIKESIASILSFRSTYFLPKPCLNTLITIPKHPRIKKLNLIFKG